MSCQDNGYPLMKTNPLKEYPMYYPDMKDYITFLFFLLDEFLGTKEHTISRGKPKTYSDASLVVFFVLMTQRRIHATRRQHYWLYTHPLLLETLRLRSCPSRLTLGRRYKALAAFISEFCEFIADWIVSNGYSSGILRDVINRF